ncbi:hypothetical protein H8356DRAFT_1335472 [Neocallimastix lanati (nom. inval.)]|nr:hypothetical protein H8356DRAFT_1335472 [Neocallimastix sp. JGI-2020a]
MYINNNKFNISNNLAVIEHKKVPQKYDSENNSIISNNVVNRSISFNRNEIISGDYSKTPFLVRFAALFTEIMPRASYKRKLTRSINAENAVRQASRSIQTLIHKESAIIVAIKKNLVFAYKELENYRNKSLVLLDDLFLKFAMIVEQKSLNVSLDSEKDYGHSIYGKIKVNDGEQRQLVDNIFKQSSTSSTVPYFVGIADVDVEMIRHYSFDNTNTEIITHNNERGVIIDEWEKLENYCF